MIKYHGVFYKMESNNQDKIDERYLKSDSRFQKEKEAEKIETEESEITEKKREKKPEKLENFIEYIKASCFIGTAFGLTVGWMWGWKGFIFGPLIGMAVGFFMSVLFSWKDGKNWQNNHGRDIDY